MAHLSAVAGFVLLPLGLLAVRAVTGRGTLAGAAFVVTWFGVGLVLPYYGAKVFALHAIGGTGGPLGLVDAVRNGPVQITEFGWACCCSPSARCWRRSPSGAPVS